MQPEKRVYRVQRNTMTEASIDRGITRDLYVSLGEPLAGNAWIVRVYFKPFVNWIWGGCLLMALGGALAATDRRYRAKQPQPQQAAAAAGIRRMKSLRFIIPLGAVRGARRSFCGAGLSLDPRKVPSPLIDKPAPAFALTRLDDAAKTIARDDMLGKVWMLNVWASWCVACREEHPTLVAFSKTKARADHRPELQGHARPTASAGSAGSATRTTLSIFDQDGRVGIDFGVYGVPETFVIDKRGVVRFKHVGPLTPEIVQTRDPSAAEGTEWLSGSHCVIRACCALALRRSACALAKDGRAGRRRPGARGAHAAHRVELRCLVCQNQTIADSNAGLAEDLRDAGARDAAQGPERRADHQVHDRPLRRLRAATGRR